MPIPNNQLSTPPPSTSLWLASLHDQAIAEYAEKKPRHRSPQTGQAWRAFTQIFGELPVPQLLRAVNEMLQLAQADDPIVQSLRNSLFPLLLEHELSGDFFGPNTGQSLPESEAAPLLRRTIQRWCDWLDADIHLHTHRYWHHSPVCFDPDPEKRQLASLGRAQLHFASQPDSIKTQWQTLHTLLAEHYKNSPKWKTVGRAMGSGAEHPWLYQEADTLIISLWPLLTRHNWTYRDLRNVARPLLRHPDSYPWRTDADLATFTINTLGLRKTSTGKTIKTGRPTGHEIAKLLFARGQT